MANHPLRIAVLKDRYPMQFMTARQSRHMLDWRPFVPFNFLHRQLEGFTLLAPGRKADLVHTNNRIPVGARKFILSFEDNAPRRAGFPQDNALTRFMDRQIASKRCRRLVAMSDFARRRFLHQHRNNPRLPELQDKLLTRYPNIMIGDEPDAMAGDDASSLILTFVGAHFARKGGCVAVKIAEKALAAGLPIRVNIISPLVMGAQVWTDPAREGALDQYKALLSLPNIRYHRHLPNRQTRAVLRQSHFCILTTFADTFGFSAIEAFAEHTPVLGTRLCALPEYVEDGHNGILIDMPVDHLGIWKRPRDISRKDRRYEEYFHSEVERIADKAIGRLGDYIGNAEGIADMRRAARRTAEEKFDASHASRFWDDLYEEVARESSASRPSLRRGPESAMAAQQ